MRRQRGELRCLMGTSSLKRTKQKTLARVALALRQREQRPLSPTRERIGSGRSPI